MKLACSLLVLGSDAMKHMEGKTDQFHVHIGGGAFDAGTSETLAKWAIRKCEKKVCSVWPWAKCPLDTTKFDKEKKLTQAPCCHKCWNKCPPYLARHKMNDRLVFQNGDKRRAIKEQIWKFLEKDIQCETTKLKAEFLNPEVNGMSFDELAHEDFEDECEDIEDQEERMQCEDKFEKYQLEKNGNDGDFKATLLNNGMMMDSVGFEKSRPRVVSRTPEEIAESNREACFAKYSEFNCHGHANAKCCSNGCLNQGNKPKEHCDACKCNGFCGYLHNPYETRRNDKMFCYLLDPQETKPKKEAQEEAEEPEE